MHRNRRTFRTGLATVAALAIAFSGATGALAQETTKPSIVKVDPARFAEPFPAATFKNLNTAAGGPEMVDLATDLGKRPVVLVYWIPTHERSEKLLLEAQRLVGDIGADKVALYSVCTVGATMPEDKVSARATELGVKVPVLLDQGFRIGQQVRVQSVPNVTVLDRGGNLRLTNGGSLGQDLEYKMTLADGIRRVADTGTLGTYGYMPQYYPAVELVGEPTPDFMAPSLSDGIVHKWSNLVDPRKINVLVFWSVDCPHCRQQLPEINAWVKENPEGINVVSAVSARNDAIRAKTREFVNLHGFIIPTLVDEEGEIFQKFLVVSTPSIIVVGPDGTIDSVLLSGSGSFATHVEARRKALIDKSG